MSRKPSVVLSAADIKAKTKDLKAAIKLQEAAVKAEDKNLTAAEKQHAAVVKAINKRKDSAAKELNKLTVQLAALTPTPATSATV